MKKQLLLLISMLLPMVAMADDSGSCGTNVTYTYVSSTGTLTIQGSGAMSNYSSSGSGTPWYSYIEDIKTVVIKDGVTSIGSYAFSSCYGLTSVTIPNSVTSIGSYAFSYCYGLTSVTIPNSVTSIGSYAFSSCYGLTSVTIPNSVTSIGSYAFYGCSRLTSVTIGNSVTSIGSYAFYGCSGLTSVNVNSGNPKYDSRNNCNAIIETSSNTLIIGFKITIIPNSVTSIGEKAFNNCDGLTSIEIPNSVTSIGGSAFYDCNNLTSVIIGNSVKSIGSQAFYNCYNLTTISCLNPTPPTCSGKKIFEASKDYVRDAYDIYTYATLHVPMGSQEQYSSAYEWRYFNKIKEDMESGGKVHYANLTVKQGTTGYTRQAVKAGEKYSIYIGSSEEKKVNTITFNGEDVTNEIVEGVYVTPEIKGESVLTVSYDNEQGLKGDVDGDGVVDVNDVQTTINIILKK